METSKSLITPNGACVEISIQKSDGTQELHRIPLNEPDVPQQEIHVSLNPVDAPSEEPDVISEDLDIIPEEPDIISTEQFEKMDNVLEKFRITMQEERRRHIDAAHMIKYIAKCFPKGSVLNGMEYEERAKYIMEGNGFSAIVLEHPLKIRDPDRRSVIFLIPPLSSTVAPVNSSKSPTNKTTPPESQSSAFPRYVTCTKEIKDLLLIPDFFKALPSTSNLNCTDITIPLFSKVSPDKDTFLEIFSWYRKYVIAHPMRYRCKNICPQELALFKLILSDYIVANLWLHCQKEFRDIDTDRYRENALYFLGIYPQTSILLRRQDKQVPLIMEYSKLIISLPIPIIAKPAERPIFCLLSCITNNNVPDLCNLLLTIGKSFLGYDFINQFQHKSPKQLTIIETNHSGFISQLLTTIFNRGVNFLHYCEPDWPSAPSKTPPFTVNRIHPQEKRTASTFHVATAYGLEESSTTPALTDSLIPQFIREQYNGIIANIACTDQIKNIRMSNFIAQLITGKPVIFHEQVNTVSLPQQFSFSSSLQHIVITSNRDDLVSKLGLNRNDYNFIKLIFKLPPQLGMEFFNAEESPNDEQFDKDIEYFFLIMLSMFYTVDKLWLERDDSVPDKYTEKETSQTLSLQELVNNFFSECCVNETERFQKAVFSLPKTDIDCLGNSEPIAKKKELQEGLGISSLRYITRSDLYFLFCLWYQQKEEGSSLPPSVNFLKCLRTALANASLGKDHSDLEKEHPKLKKQYLNFFYSRKTAEDKYLVKESSLVKALNSLELQEALDPVSTERTLLYGVYVAEEKADMLISNAKKKLYESPEKAAKIQDDFFCRLDCIAQNMRADVNQILNSPSWLLTEISRIVERNHPSAGV